MKKYINFLLLLFILTACSPKHPYVIKYTLNFGNAVFTQGLYYDDDKLYFTSEPYKKSFYGIYDIGIQEIIEKYNVDNKYFLEGLDIDVDKINCLYF